MNVQGRISNPSYIFLQLRGFPGAIMAEADVAKIISRWERGPPALKQQAVLNKI